MSIFEQPVAFNIEWSYVKKKECFFLIEKVYLLLWNLLLNIWTSATMKTDIQYSLTLNVIQHLRNGFQSTFPQRCDSLIYIFITGHYTVSVSNVVVNLGLISTPSQTVPLYRFIYRLSWDNTLYLYFLVAYCSTLYQATRQIWCRWKVGYKFSNKIKIKSRIVLDIVISPVSDILPMCSSQSLSSCFFRRDTDFSTFSNVWMSLIFQGEAVRWVNVEHWA